MAVRRFINLSVLLLGNVHVTRFEEVNTNCITMINRSSVNILLYKLLVHAQNVILKYYHTLSYLTFTFPSSLVVSVDYITHMYYYFFRFY